MRHAMLTSILLLSSPAFAEDVAALMLVQGDVVVMDGGAPVPGRVGQVLTPDDTVVTAWGGVAILHLWNNHLVRVDEDLRLTVSDIVLLDAPETPLDAKASLAQLLYDDERDTIPDLARAERVAGWHARLTAGYTPGSEAETPLGRGEDAVAQRARPRTPGPAPEPALARPDDLAPTAPPARRSRSARNTRAMSADDLTHRLTQGDLSACVLDWARALPVPIDTVTLHLRFTDGAITRVLADRGLTPPACARALEGERVRVDDRALTISVPVPAE